MAFAVDQLSDIISGRTIDFLQANPGIIALMDRSHQEEFDQGNYKVSVPIFTSQKDPDTSLPGSASGRNVDYAALTEEGSTRVSFNLDQQSEVGRKVYWRDQKELPLNLLEQTAKVIGARQVRRIDDNLYSYLVASVPAAQIEAEVPANTITKGGVAANVATGTAVWDMIWDYELYAYEEEFGPDSATPFTRILTMPPPVFTVLRKQILASNWSDALNEDVITRGTAHLGINPQQANVRAVLNDTLIVVSSRFPAQDDGAVKNYACTGLTNRAITAGIDTLGTLTSSVTPQENMTGPFWGFVNTVPFGRLDQDDRFLKTYLFRMA